MRMQKAYVNEDGITVLKCPFCSHARTVSVASFREKKKVIRVRCSCQESYAVALELRRLYRKSTSLKGSYINLSRNNESGAMIVKDISMGGIGFETLDKRDIEPEDELVVTFTLDDTHSSVIKKQVLVKIIKERFVGCEFRYAHEDDKALVFYLLP